MEKKIIVIFKENGKYYMTDYCNFNLNFRNKFYVNELLNFSNNEEIKNYFEKYFNGYELIFDKSTY